MNPHEIKLCEDNFFGYRLINNNKFALVTPGGLVKVWDIEKDKEIYINGGQLPVIEFGLVLPLSSSRILSIGLLTKSINIIDFKASTTKMFKYELLPEEPFFHSGGRNDRLYSMLRGSYVLLFRKCTDTYIWNVTGKDSINIKACIDNNDNNLIGLINCPSH